MSNPQLKIALAFSGGGYRAACFCLGTLSYLDRLKVKNKSLLEHVTVLSTVSGGTITGAAYTIGIKQGREFSMIYKSIYGFIKNTDLVTLSLDRLLSNEGWGESRVKSLINAFADVYDKKLFNREKFGALMTDENPIHLKHITFNATEFSNALQFRFQWSEKMNKLSVGESPRGIIGNYEFRISEEAAKEIRMADILAASSCFPGGFEPINFPDDFIYNEAVNLKNLAVDSKYPVGLMDGGIVDNQGIESILLAESRMKKNSANPDSDERVLDLIILSDVASLYMENYVATVQQPAKGWRRLTPAAILAFNTLLLLVSGFGIYWYSKIQSISMVIASVIIATISLLIFIIGRLLKSLPLKFDVPKFFLKPLGKLLRIKLQVYETMIANRKNSMLKMINEVFLKHIRRLNYNKIYNDDSWKNRRIMNAIYELKTNDKIAEKIKKGTLPDYLMPSPEVQNVATLATSMGTTLWFTKEEHKKNMMNTIISCGQFTLCWNLLEFIQAVKRDNKNINPNHDLILQMEEPLKKDWSQFQKDPFWFVDEIN